MTTRLFFENDTLTMDVDVLSCTPDGEEFAVILLATIFHPQGGGQPSDTGYIGDNQVLRVVHQQEQLVHYLAKPIKPGTYCARVDNERRLLNTRMHSAGHLIGNIGEGYGWQPVKAHHWPGEGGVHLNGHKTHRYLILILFRQRWRNLSGKIYPDRFQYKVIFAKLVLASYRPMPVVVPMSVHCTNWVRLLCRQFQRRKALCQSIIGLINQ